MAATPRNVNQSVKTCQHCGETKPREEFKPHGTKRDRRHPYCLECWPIVWPELRAAQMKADREWQHRKRHGAPVERESAPKLESTRIRDWLLSLDMGRDQLGEWLGVGERAIGRWISGESKTVMFDQFDRALCHAGVPWVLRELFPELWEFDDEAVDLESEMVAA